MKLKTKYAAGMRDELEGMLGCTVEVVEDREAKYPCKMEYARNYGRDRHVVRVNPARCVSEYPVFMMMLVTWAKAFPDKLDMLGLPYKAAYASALSMSERLQ